MSVEPDNLLALIAAQMEAAMAKLEVRLIDRFAGKKDLEEMDRRVEKLETVHWQMRGIILALIFVITTLATVSWHIWG